MVRSVDVVMKVIAYTNSLTTSEKVKITTVRIPGSETGKTTENRVRNREAPSTSAASSSSAGIVRKKPIRSHVENGTVNDGYTRMSETSLSWRPSSAITRDMGRNRRVGGTR